MHRRTLLAGLGTAATAGCLGVSGSEPFTLPAALEEPPGHVYIPTQASGMELLGTADAGEFRLGLLYSYPDRFWELTGTKRYLRPVEDADSVHFMALAWDPETGTVFPEVGLTTEVRRDGELVAQEAVYAMLSQRMGFHYGDNFALPGDGRYEVTVSVGGLQLERTGAFAGRFDQPRSATFTFDYSRASRDDIPFREVARAGEPGAIDPMNVTEVPNATAPRLSTLPGETIGVPTLDGASMPATLVRGDDTERFGDDPYVLVSPRTPYSEMVLPTMGLTGRLVRDGTTVHETTLERTVDPEFRYHYGGTFPSVESGDELVVDVLTPPQVARHEGYETAFIEMDTARYEIA